MNRKSIFALSRIFISVALLGFLAFLMRDKLDDLLQVIKKVNVPLFFFSILFILPLVLLSSLRLQCFLSVQGIYFKLHETIKLNLIGYFFNNFMPSTVGGDVAKIYYVKRRSGDYTRPFSAILIDRIIGLAALIVFAAIAVMFWGKLINSIAAKSIVLLSLLFLISAICLIYFRIANNVWGWLLGLRVFIRLKKKILNISKAINLYRGSKALLLGFSFSCLSHGLMAVYAFCLAKTLNIDLALPIFLILIPVVSLISCLPSLNGLGIREGAFVYFFKEFIAPEQALALSILYFAQMIILSCIGGLVYLFNGAEIIKEVSDD
ncbi:MAG: flippase-like domain-containing protein [Candidatus Omnitrophica bacterium]|nr:flippase-like domain-containing protein [Candidatus Omnitrophota bacterium]